jgi:nucleoside-diphosphate-sugar epimerase
MKILIYGAGVVGQIYAARLHEAGHDVTVLARRRTLETLARDGITLVNGALVNGATSWPGPGERDRPCRPGQLVRAGPGDGTT